MYKNIEHEKVYECKKYANDKKYAKSTCKCKCVLIV